MGDVRLADRLNRLPYGGWVSADEGARIIGLSREESRKVLRSGRRRGALSVRRNGKTLEYMRIWRLS